MRHYCTLFDSSYLAKGLVLYESLKKHSSEPFLFYVLAMDDEVEHDLVRLGLDGLFFVSRKDFERDTGLIEIKATRTWQEFCWTCASNLANYLLPAVEEITYLDADMMFFSDPAVIFDEIGDRSIAVIPHRLISAKQHLEVNGKFNVSWVTFKNSIGRACAATWAWQCRDKCSAKEGCGDQKYLDEWPQKYGDDLCIIQNIGAGLAPWNLANYHLIKRDDELVVSPAHGGFHYVRHVVFYHYHEFKENDDGTFRLTNYHLRPEDVELIYKPYVGRITLAKGHIESLRIQA